MGKSKIGEVESTSKEKTYLPFWNQHTLEISEKLWLPIKTDCQGLDITLSDGLLKNMEENSWFSMKLICHPNRNLSATSYQSSTSSLVGYTDSENTVTKSRKIRIYPNEKQRQILREWFGVARYTYNQTVAYLKEPGTKASWKGIKTNIIHKLPEWAKPVPYQIKSIAIRDACKAVSSAKKKYIKERRFNSVKFRTKKDKNENIFIPKSAIKSLSFYKTLIGDIYSSEHFNGQDTRDSRVVFQSGRYYITIPSTVHTKQPENQRFGLVALDPGVRTFQTFYSNKLAGKIGQGDFGRIQRLCYHLDALTSKIAKAKSRQKYRMRKAANRLRWKIKDSISEIHHKTALFLCRNFNSIILPHFETGRMVSKLRSKTARAMLTWSHFKFSEILGYKAIEFGVDIIRQDEAYTSKTCGVCGCINNIGAKEELKCKCGVVIDRDYNGARNIMIRALGDTPCLINNQTVLVNN